METPQTLSRHAHAHARKPEMSDGEDAQGGASIMMPLIVGVLVLVMGCCACCSSSLMFAGVAQRAAGLKQAVQSNGGVGWTIFDKLDGF